MLRQTVPQWTHTRHQIPKHHRTITTQEVARRHATTAPTTTATTATTKKFRVEFSKKSSPPTMPSMVIEGKKVTSARNSARDNDERIQQSIHSTRNKISSGVQKSQNILKTTLTSSMTSITRDDNTLKDESMTLTDIPINKSINRRSSNIERETTKSRKMEFSMRDGVKWQNASSE